VDDAELLEALRETTEHLIDESRQLRAKSERLIARSQHLRRTLRGLGKRRPDKAADALRPAA